MFKNAKHTLELRKSKVLELSNDGRGQSEIARIYLSLQKIILGLHLWLGRIYIEDDIGGAKASPSFEREYNLKYLGLIGNVFHFKDIEAAIENGRNVI